MSLEEHWIYGTIIFQEHCHEIIIMIMIIMMDNTEERVVMPITMSDTQDWGVTPAPGAPPKGVRAYLSRWGSAQPQPTRYTSCSSSRYTVQTGEKRTSDPAALLLPRPGASSADVRER